MFLNWNCSLEDTLAWWNHHSFSCLPASVGGSDWQANPLCWAAPWGQAGQVVPGPSTILGTPGPLCHPQVFPTEGSAAGQRQASHMGCGVWNPTSNAVGVDEFQIQYLVFLDLCLPCSYSSSDSFPMALNGCKITKADPRYKSSVLI